MKYANLFTQKVGLEEAKKQEIISNITAMKIHESLENIWLNNQTEGSFFGNVYKEVKK